MEPQQQHNARRIRSRMIREGRRPVDAEWFGSTRVRQLLGLVLSLAAVLVLFNLPLSTAQFRAGWMYLESTEYISMDFMPRQVQDIYEKPAITAHPSGLVDEPSLLSTETTDLPAGDDDAAEATSGEEGGQNPHVLPAMQPLRIYRADLRQPVVPGGMASIYLQIRYPEEARHLGIQGRVVLNFLVESNGVVTDIRVTQPVHPLLDSAAVRGVRNTIFLPGQENGKPVAFRMNLPIRFELLNYGRPGVSPNDSQLSGRYR